MPKYQYLPRSLPEHEGIYSRYIIDTINEIELRGIELHSLMIAKNGKVVFEGHSRPYARDIPHILHSMTKAFTNTAVAMVYSNGLITLEDKLVDFFPDHVPENANEYLRSITIKNLITMRSGHSREISGNEWRPLKTSWVDAFFQEPVVHRPGEVYCYSSGNSYMLSAIVQKVTGMTAHNYLKDCFISKVGMRDFTWDVSPEGICSGGNGISLCIEDIVKIGLVYLNRGVWNGEQVIDPAWVDRSFGRIDYHEPPEGVRPYNYHWFQYGNVYAASGLFGQHCIVVPDLDMVIGVTSAFRTGNDIVEIMKQYLVSPLAADCKKDYPDSYSTILINKGRRLSLEWNSHSVEDHLELSQGKHVYTVIGNPDHITEMTLECDDDAVTFGMTDHRGTHRICCCLDGWYAGTTSMTGDYLHHQYQPEETTVVGMAYWKKRDLLFMEWRYPEMTFCDYVTFSFSDNGKKLAMNRRVNVNSQSMSRPTVYGDKLD